MPSPAAIEAVRLLAHPPAAVWRALVDPARLSRWLMPTNLVAEVGAAFTFDTGGWGLVQGVVQTVEVERCMSVTWTNGPLQTTLTWTLEAVEGQTRLTTVHDGFDLDDPRQRFAFDGMGAGWRGPVTDRLVALLDAEATR